jgi:natural product biosynthesis luciferase-like monooxygenase protein
MNFAIFELPGYFADRHGSEGDYLRKAMDRLASAEALGFDAIWINEHHFHPHGGLFSSLPVILSALAQRTSRVRLGTSVMVLPLHSPIEVAEQLALVDLLSGGRLDVGVGRGVVKYDYDVMGVPFAEGQARTIEALTVLLKAWSTRPFSHEGQFFHFTDVAIWPLPQQQPHPPIWFSATRTPESFATAGRLGLNLLTLAHLNPMADLAERVRLYRQSLVEAGHDPTQFRVGSHFHVLVTEHPAEARRLGQEALERHLQRGVDSQAQAKDAPIRPEYRALVASGHRVDIDTFIETGRVLIGTPDECVALARRIRDEVGLDSLNCTFSWGGLDDRTVERSLHLFASEVMPRARGEMASRLPGLG